MAAVIWLGFGALILSLILTPVFRRIFRYCGFVDKPDQVRKIHSEPIPRAGGTAIAVSYVASFLIAQYGFGLFNQQLGLVWNVLPAVAVMFAVGLIDDLWGLKPWQKLGGQLIACGIACNSGILILDIIGKHERAWWTIPITVLWLIACSNAFNLVDGLDGLAGGVGLFATLTILVAALMDGRTALAMATVALAGCLLGFLRYNFAPATVYLGDSGSLVIGFVLGCFAVIWTQKSATLLGLAAPIMALSIPLLDVGLAIVRRFLRRQPIFTADRGHIHHMLLNRGMSTRQAALVLYLTGSFVAVFSLLYSRSHNNQVASAIILIFCAVAWMGIQYLGYAEFTLAGRLLFRGDLQRALKSQLDIHSFDRALMAAPHAESCVKLVVDSARQFGLVVTGLQLAGETFSGPYSAVEQRWQARISFGEGNFVELSRDTGDLPASASAGPFLDALRTGMHEKLPKLEGARNSVSSGSRVSAW